MEPKLRNSLCVFCWKEVSTLGGTLNGKYSPNFVQFFSRYLNIQLETSDDTTNADVWSCYQCIELVDEFCYLYTQQENIRLQLEWKTRQLSQIMAAAASTAANGPSIQYQNVEAGTDETYDRKLSKLRQELMKGCERKIRSSYPKVILKKIKEEVPEESQQIIENVTEPLNHVEILQWLLTFVAVVNLSSLSFHPQLEAPTNVYQPHRNTKKYVGKKKQEQTDHQVNDEGLQHEIKVDFPCTPTLNHSELENFEGGDGEQKLNEQSLSETINGEEDENLVGVIAGHEIDIGFQSLINCESYEELQVEADMIGLYENDDIFSQETISEFEALLATAALVESVPNHKDHKEVQADFQLEEKGCQLNDNENFPLRAVVSIGNTSPELPEHDLLSPSNVFNATTVEVSKPVENEVSQSPQVFISQPDHPSHFPHSLLASEADNVEDDGAQVNEQSSPAPEELDRGEDYFVREVIVNFDEVEDATETLQEYAEPQFELIFMNNDSVSSKTVSEQEAVTASTPVSVLSSTSVFSADDESIVCSTSSLTNKTPVLPTLHQNSYHELKSSFTCPQCQHQFLTADLFRQHITTVHQAEAGLPDQFQCGICQERFSTVAFLRMHKSRAHKPRNDGDLKLFQRRNKKGLNSDKKLDVSQQPLLLNKVQVEPPSSPTETVEGSILKSAAVTSPPYPSSNQEHSGDKTIPNSQADHDFLRDATSKHQQSTSAALLISPSVEKENLNTPQGTNAQGSRKRKSNLKDCESTYSVRKPKLASQSDTEENQTQPS